MACPICVPTGPMSAPVCRTCGRVLAVLPVPVPTPAKAGWEGRAPDWVQDGLRRWRTDWHPRVLNFLRQARTERTGLLAAGVVLLVSLVVTLVGWWPLSKPPIWINQVVAVVTPTSCTGFFGKEPFFSLCASTLGIMTMSGSLLSLLLLFFFRQQLTRAVQRLMARLSPELSFLAAPVIATLVFTTTWAGNAFHFFDRNGILPDGLFPPVVGLLTYASVRYGPDLMQRLAALMERRDRVPLKVRLGLMVAVLWLLSILLEGKVRHPVRDQLLVIIGVIAGYLAMAPRTGNLGAHLHQAISGWPQPGARPQVRKEEIRS